MRGILLSGETSKDIAGGRADITMPGQLANGIEICLFILGDLLGLRLINRSRGGSQWKAIRVGFVYEGDLPASNVLFCQSMQIALML